MMPKKLHPSVVNFKEFVSNNPKLILEVRKGEATWQELYEDWYLLGEEDSRWEIIRSENKIQSEENTDKKVIGFPLLWEQYKKWIQSRFSIILIT